MKHRSHAERSSASTNAPRRAWVTGPRALRLITALVLCAGVLCACVTVKDTSKRKGVPLGTGSRDAGAKDPLANGSLARPVSTDSTNTARVQVSVVPLGSIPYDGQTLPIVSPDGSLLAVQQGEAPTLDTLLANQNATPALATRIVVIELAQHPQATPRTVRDCSTDLPAGCVLGRDANTRGFLVEWPRDGGSRWIGIVPWLGGAPEWLVQGQSVNAHAVFLPSGELAFTLRLPESDKAVLVVQHADGARSTLARADATLLAPTPGPGGTLLCFAGTKEGLELLSMLSPPPTMKTIDRTMRVRFDPLDALGLDPDAAAYEATASLQPSAWSTGEITALRSASLLTSRALGGMVACTAPTIVRATDRVALRPLLTGSIAGMAWSGNETSRPGFFLTTRDGLFFLPEHTPTSGASNTPAPKPTKVLGKPYVPRAVRTDQGPAIIAIGPDAGSQKSLELLRVLIGVPLPP